MFKSFSSYLIINTFTVISILLLQGCCCCCNDKFFDQKPSTDNTNQTKTIDKVVQDIVEDQISDITDNISDNVTDYPFLYTKDNTIYLYSPDSKESTKIINGANPAMSPNMTQFAFSNIKEYRNAGIFIYDINTGNTRELLPESNFVSNLSWSPDGKHLVYLDRDNTFKLNIINIEDGTNKTLISEKQNGIYSSFQPSWSSDSRSICFQDMNNLYYIDLNGNIISKEAFPDMSIKIEAMSSEDKFSENPVDSNLIIHTMMVKGTNAFEKNFGEPNSGLFLYNKLTRESIRLSPEDILVTYPTWSKDGKYIYFTGYEDKYMNEKDPFRIYRIKPDGTELEELQKGSEVSL